MHNILRSKEYGKLTFLKGKAQAYIKGAAEYTEVPEKLKASDALYLEGAFIASLEMRGGV